MYVYNVIYTYRSLKPKNYSIMSCYTIQQNPMVSKNSANDNMSQGHSSVNTFSSLAFV